jgi:glycosidase
MKKWIFFGWLIGIGISTLSAQVVTTDPAFATENDVVTVYFHADQGNGALDGYVPIYAHTGVITSNSSSPTDWQHVVGNWGTPDPEVLMTFVSPNVHKIEIDIQNFYGINPGETVYALAFVFRNADGSVVGRNADGGDIYYSLYQGGNVAELITPALQFLATNDETIEIEGQSSSAANLSLYVDETLLLTLNDTTEISSSFETADYSEGQHWIFLEAEFEDETIRDSVTFGIMAETQILPLPEEVKEGINTWVGSDTVTFNLFAPDKGRIYLLGDFNDWQFSNDYLLNQTPDGQNHWITIRDLDLTQEYAFQYFIVDEGLLIGDPYAEKVLDPWNDPYITDETYPNLKPYPTGEIIFGIVSVFQIEQEAYVWNDQDYVRPDKEDLIIYELLVRDFVEGHSYQILMDTLDYLERLGINAIELMPVNEFEGNNSWGYNPSFYFAPDKYYGPKNTYKAFIDECHARGIAVIMDIALNHSFGQNPQVRMYFDPSAGSYGQPTPESPWFNEVPKHDFNVGYDYNHESPYTKKFADSVLTFWVKEYHIDGYRMDLSKGFTQNNTLGDVGAGQEYDQSRIDILTNYANHVWNYDEDIYFVLEHFAYNDEETVLANTGFMLWGNLNHEYLEASMGYPSNLIWGSYQARGWDDPHLVTLMESHDEERMMYKNLTYGASQGDYDVTELGTALERSALAATLFFPIPGPKMIWQFGELGYDYSINTCEDGTVDPGCRLSPKPIRWDYYTEWQRKKLFDVYAELIRVKKEYELFSTTDYSMNVGTPKKVIYLNGEEMKGVVVGNFYLTAAPIDVTFQHDGYWYELFTGDSLLVDISGEEQLNMAAGEYRLYTDVRIGEGIITSLEDEFTVNSLEVYPNPTSNELFIQLPEKQFNLANRNPRHDRKDYCFGSDSAGCKSLPMDPRPKRHIRSLPGSGAFGSRGIQKSSDLVALGFFGYRCI